MLAETRGSPGVHPAHALAASGSNILIQEFIGESRGATSAPSVVGDRVVAASEAHGRGWGLPLQPRIVAGPGRRHASPRAYERAAPGVGAHHGAARGRGGHAGVARRAQGDRDQPSPGFEGLEKATGVDVARAMVEYATLLRGLLACRARARQVRCTSGRAGIRSGRPGLVPRAVPPSRSPIPISEFYTAEAVSIPVTVIRGRQPGPTVFLVRGHPRGRAERGGDRAPGHPGPHPRQDPRHADLRAGGQPLRLPAPLSLPPRPPRPEPLLPRESRRSRRPPGGVHHLPGDRAAVRFRHRSAHRARWGTGNLPTCARTWASPACAGWPRRSGPSSSSTSPGRKSTPAARGHRGRRPRHRLRGGGDLQVPAPRGAEGDLRRLQRPGRAGHAGRSPRASPLPRGGEARAGCGRSAEASSDLRGASRGAPVPGRCRWAASPTPSDARWWRCARDCTGWCWGPPPCPMVHPGDAVARVARIEKTAGPVERNARTAASGRARDRSRLRRFRHLTDPTSRLYWRALSRPQERPSRRSSTIAIDPPATPEVPDEGQADDEEGRCQAVGPRRRPHTKAPAGQAPDRGRSKKAAFRQGRRRPPRRRPRPWPAGTRPHPVPERRVDRQGQAARSGAGRWRSTAIALLAKQRELTDAYATVKGESREVPGSDGTEDYIDYAVNSYAKGFTALLTELDRKQLILVEDALRRIDRGGVRPLHQCGDPINPSASRCSPGHATACAARSWRVGGSA